MTSPKHQNVVLVTGAARGLGAVVAHAFAKDHRVIVSDIDGARLEGVVAGIVDDGGQAIGVELDVRKKNDFEAALEKGCKVFGGIGVLVNNAAVTKTTPVFDITPDEFSAVVDVNLRGVFLACQVFGAAFREQGYGRIINMASLAAQNGGAATGAHYAASKGGVITLTKVFARDLASAGVTVNAISPGPLDVDLVREILPPEKLKSVIGQIPVGRLGDPKFIAELAILLASPAAQSVTGATFDANGGLYAR